MCGRASFNVQEFVHTFEYELYSLQKSITVAVMGCVVNGPGEAKQADIGITGTNTGAIIFKKGKVIKKLPLSRAYEAFADELNKYSEA